MKNQNTERATGYNPGHPWYYLRGGCVQTPRQIIETVKERQYKGYKSDDIQKANSKPEPQRSEALRKIRNEVYEDFRSDLSIYRETVCDLRKYRKEHRLVTEKLGFDQVHGDVALKYNHLFNDLAHLLRLDELLSYQLDLFNDWQAPLPG